MNDTILVRPPVAHPDRFFIGGEWVVPSSSDTIRVIAPATEELYLSVAEAREADIDRAVAADRKSTRLNSSNRIASRMPSSA